MSTTTHHPHLILHPYPLTLLTSPTNPNTTGLLTGIELEITNIIPQDENAEIILRNLRDVNADHAVVGWYTTRAQGATTNKAGNTWGSAEDVEILEKYQTEMEGGGVCIVYDPEMSAATNHISLKAYKLTPRFIAFFQNKRYTSEAMAAYEITQGNIFEEIPIRIQNTGYANSLLWEIEPKNEYRQMELAGQNILESRIESTINIIDEYLQDANKYDFYLRNLQRYQSQLNSINQKRRQENVARAASGLALLPEETALTNQKPPVEPARLDTLLHMSQIDSMMREVGQLSGLERAKLYTLESIA